MVECDLAKVEVAGSTPVSRSIFFLLKFSKGSPIVTETVLCIKKNRLPGTWVRQKSIVPMTMDQFTQQCTNAGFGFIRRADAENDFSYKQIIPYIVLQTKDLKMTAVYHRRGSEARLHDLWSVGIGGHINPVDMDATDTEFEKVLMAGMERELSEELERMPPHDQPLFQGIISEEITEVGKVHLGAVFRILTQNAADYLPGDELFGFGWKKTADLNQLTLELWSDMALELIS